MVVKMYLIVKRIMKHKKCMGQPSTGEFVIELVVIGNSVI